VGEGATVTLLNVRAAQDYAETKNVEAVVQRIGFAPHRVHCLSWDLFDSVLTPGDLILMATWKDDLAAQSFAVDAASRAEARLRRVRIVRDYGMYDRREAPQYYPEVARKA